MARLSKTIFVLLMAALLFIGSSSAASVYRRKPDTAIHKITVPSSPTAHQDSPPTVKIGSHDSTHRTFSSRKSPLRLKRSHQSDVSVAANTGTPPCTQQNDTSIASTVTGYAAYLPPEWRAWLPTFGTILNSVVHVIIMILGVLNISINPRIHGEKLEMYPRKTVFLTIPDSVPSQTST